MRETLLSDIQAAKPSPYSFAGMPIKTAKSLPEKITIIKDVMELHHGISFEQANVKSNVGDLVRFRQNYYYLVRKYTSVTLKGTGLHFKGRSKTHHGIDHTTVLWGIEKWEQIVKQNYKGCREIHYSVLNDLNRIFKLVGNEHI